jgi:hypothetical protein
MGIPGLFGEKSMSANFPRKFSICLLVIGCTLTGMVLIVPGAAGEKVGLSVGVSRPGAKIDRNIFGQFAELCVAKTESKRDSAFQQVAARMSARTE